MDPRRLVIEDVGRLGYAAAYHTQRQRVEAVLAARAAGEPVVGVLLLVEHEPVITVSRRPSAAAHVVASAEALSAAGVAVERTDRGGDVTYHGPGQLVAYPILDLNHLGLRLHEYMRLLEGAVIDACAGFGVRAFRDPEATGVWTDQGPGEGSAKLCAMGVRVRRWISMHGLALNVETNLEHFSLIVPCGLAGRGVTSLREVLGDECPSLKEAKEGVAAALRRRIEARVGPAGA